MFDPQSGRAILLDQLHQPCVVGVAAQITRFDVFVPKAGQQEDDGNGDKDQPLVPNETGSDKYPGVPNLWNFHVHRLVDIRESIDANC
jgi:hypothetical protein